MPEPARLPWSLHNLRFSTHYAAVPRGQNPLLHEKKSLLTTRILQDGHATGGSAPAGRPRRKPGICHRRHRAIKRSLAAGQEARLFAEAVIFPKIGKKTMLLNARCMAGLDNQTQWILLAMEDVTNAH